MTEPLPATAWQRSRERVLAEITETAIALFLADGFEATTIRAIAERAGISERSFFRYFGTKEEILLRPLSAQGPELLEALRARPDTESPWDALTAALSALRGLGVGASEELAISKMLHETPSLRARSSEKHLDWEHLLAPEIRRRLGVDPQDETDPQARALIASALACLDVVGEIWARSDGTLDRMALWHSAIGAVRR